MSPTFAVVGPQSLEFDSNLLPGAVPGTPVPADSNWHRLITIRNQEKSELLIDIAVSNSGTANLRLTRAAKTGESHSLLQTDMTQVNKYVPLATLNGTGTVNAPTAGSIVSLNVDATAGAEIGVECQVVTGTPIVRVYGSAA